MLNTLSDLLLKQAWKQPRKEAFTWISEGLVQQQTVTYETLDNDAKHLASRLLADEVHDHRAALLYPPGLDFLKGLFGCFYAGVVAIPLSPPERNRDNKRLKAILSDAAPKIILTTDKYVELTRDFLLKNGFQDIHCIASDSLKDVPSAENDIPAITANRVAYLQYTSGSTAHPKGVMLSHHNVLDNLQKLDSAFRHSAESVCASWLPHFHDMGLVYGLLEPVFKGIPGILMSPHAFVHRPSRWLEIISRFRVTHTAAPNFAYDLCVSRSGTKDDLQLDLSCWEAAISGAEPVRFETIEKFSQSFSKYGFRRSCFCPGYGLAEATLIVTGTTPGIEPTYLSVDSASLRLGEMRYPMDGSAISTFVGCGQAVSSEVIIVDPDRKSRKNERQVGEIWVASESVALGYAGQPEVTSDVFSAYLDDGHGPFLRTGDLGAIVKGELYITGRIKDLIIIRGQNIYPQDLEQTVENSHPYLVFNASAAFAVQSPETEEIVIVGEVSKHGAEEGPTIASAIRRSIAMEHGVQISAVALLRAGTLAKTSSGKVQRHACRNAYMAGSLSAIGIHKFEIALPLSELGIS